MREEPVFIDDSPDESQPQPFLLAGILGERHSLVQACEFVFTDGRCRIFLKPADGLGEDVSEFSVGRVVSCQSVRPREAMDVEEGEERIVVPSWRLSFDQPVRFCYARHKIHEEKAIILCAGSMETRFLNKLKESISVNFGLDFDWHRNVAVERLQRFELFCGKCASTLRRRSPTGSAGELGSREVCESVSGWKIGSVALAPSAISRLDKRGFLDDSLIGFFLEFVQTFVLQEDQRSRFHFFNSFFYTALERSCLEGNGYQDVRKWTKSLGARNVTLFDYDYVVMPLNLGMSHWCLCLVVRPSLALQNADGSIWRAPSSSAVEGLGESIGAGMLPFEEDSGGHTRYSSRRNHITKCRRPALIFLDSLRTADPKETIRNRIVGYLQQEFENKCPDDFRSGFRVADVDNWEFIPNPRVPHQHNGFDCGVYLIEYARHLAIQESLVDLMLNDHLGKACGPPLPRVKVWFSQANVSYRRLAMKNMLRIMRDNPNWRQSGTITERLRKLFSSSDASHMGNEGRNAFLVSAGQDTGFILLGDRAEIEERQAIIDIDRTTGSAGSVKRKGEQLNNSLKKIS